MESNTNLINNQDTQSFPGWKKHIRLRPEMYIGIPGDGLLPEDGLYRLIREGLGKAISNFESASNPIIEVSIKGQAVSIRDNLQVLYPEGLFDEVSERGGDGIGSHKTSHNILKHYGVGLKTVNLLSSSFIGQSTGDGRTEIAEFAQGRLIHRTKEEESYLPSGNLITFIPDVEIFGQFHFIPEFVEQILWSYVYMNSGLEIQFNGQSFQAKKGLSDLLERHVDFDVISYPVVHLKDRDFEFAFTHIGGELNDQNYSGYSDEYYCFVNGQNTVHGDTYLAAFREAIVDTIREFYNKDFETQDILASFIAAISIKKTKTNYQFQFETTKLYSQNMNFKWQTLGGFVKLSLDNFLHSNPDTAEALMQKILQAERARSAYDDLKLK